MHGHRNCHEHRRPGITLVFWERLYLCNKIFYFLIPTVMNTEFNIRICSDDTEFFSDMHAENNFVSS